MSRIYLSTFLIVGICISNGVLGDDVLLSDMPTSFGPWNDAWTNSLALCTIMRDENVTDVIEWIQYHRWLGVDHIFLTENASQHPIKDGLQAYIDSGFVTYKNEPTPHAQLMTYHGCLMNNRTDFNWMAFIDADEIIGVREQGSTLKSILDEFRYSPGIGIFWIEMGSNGRLTRPEMGGFLRHYTKCTPAPHTHIKIMVNTFFVRRVGAHPHNMFYRGEANAVSESRHPIKPVIISKDCKHGDDSCMMHPGHQETDSMLRTVNRLALFHYITKSQEDFDVKATRGGGDGTFKPQSYFDYVQSTQEDAPICQELSKLADQCCLSSPMPQSIQPP